MRIIIIGGCQSGKTIMAAMISKMLDDRKVEHSVTDGDKVNDVLAKKINLSKVSKLPVANIFNIMKDRGGKVEIETFQTARSKKETQYQVK